MTGPQNIRKRLRPKGSKKANSKKKPKAKAGEPKSEATEPRFVRHKVVDYCIGSGWRNMDRDYCSEEIITYQYKLNDKPTRDEDFRHYMRCARCSARRWQRRRMEDLGLAYH